MYVPCAGERGQRGGGRRYGRLPGRAAVAPLRAAAQDCAQARCLAASVRAQAGLARQSKPYYLLNTHYIQ